jgi:hypothetical protein
MCQCVLHCLFQKRQKPRLICAKEKKIKLFLAFCVARVRYSFSTKMFCVNILVHGLHVFIFLEISEVHKVHFSNGIYICLGLIKYL